MLVTLDRHTASSNRQGSVRRTPYVLTRRRGLVTNPRVEILAHLAEVLHPIRLKPQTL